MVRRHGARQGGTTGIRPTADDEEPCRVFEMIDHSLTALAGMHPAVVCLLTGLFVCLETSLFVGLLVPGDSVVLLAGTTVTGPGRFALLVAAGTLGSLVGESVGYLLGRRYGDRLLRSGLLRRRLGAWDQAERFFGGRGGRAVAAARFVAVVHAVVPLVAGAAGMRYRRFLGWSAVGATAWSLLYVSIGTAAGTSWRQFGERLGLAGLAALAVLVGAAWLVRRTRRRPRAHHRPAPVPSARPSRQLAAVACRADEPASPDRRSLPPG
jgi:membrane-associated protein